MSACETCGTELINRCLQCGAPVCCPKCCREATAELRRELKRAELFRKLRALVGHHVPTYSGDEDFDANKVFTHMDANEPYDAGFQDGQAILAREILALMMDE